MKLYIKFDGGIEIDSSEIEFEYSELYEGVQYLPFKQYLECDERWKEDTDGFNLEKCLLRGKLSMENAVIYDENGNKVYPV